MSKKLVLIFISFIILIIFSLMMKVDAAVAVQELQMKIFVDSEPNKIGEQIFASDKIIFGGEPNDVNAVYIYIPTTLEFAGEFSDASGKHFLKLVVKGDSINVWTNGTSVIYHTNIDCRYVTDTSVKKELTTIDIAAMRECTWCAKHKK